MGAGASRVYPSTPLTRRLNPTKRANARDTGALDRQPTKQALAAASNNETKLAAEVKRLESELKDAQAAKAAAPEDLEMENMIFSKCTSLVPAQLPCLLRLSLFRLQDLGHAAGGGIPPETGKRVAAA